MVSNSQPPLGFNSTTFALISVILSLGFLEIRGPHRERSQALGVCSIAESEHLHGRQRAYPTLHELCIFKVFHAQSTVRSLICTQIQMIGKDEATANCRLKSL